MKRSQTVLKTLPPRQASHALFVGEIVGKYGGMQRIAGKLPLTHRISASSDRRKRKAAPKPAPLQVQIVLPPPAPGPVRVIERERPAYRDRLVTALPPANPEFAKADRNNAKEPLKERVIEREKVIERERVVERKEIVERERVVEKKVVIVREVERLIREQRLLREQAVMLPIQGSDAKQPAFVVQPKQRPQVGPAVHTQVQTQPDRLRERGGSRDGTGFTADAIDRSQHAESSDWQLVRDARSGEQPEQANLSSRDELSNRHRHQPGQAIRPMQAEHSSRLGQSGQQAALDNNRQENHMDQAIRAGRTSYSSPETGISDLTAMGSSDSQALAQGGLPAPLAMQRQSWPLHIAKKSGWRATPERIQPVQSNTRPRKNNDRRHNKKKKFNQPQSRIAPAEKAKSIVPGITLINRKMRIRGDKPEQEKWRLSPALPSSLRENRPVGRPTVPVTAVARADSGVPAVNHANRHDELGMLEQPVAAGRAIVADPLRLRNDKPAQYRFVHTGKHSDLPADSGRLPLPTPSLNTLAQLMRDRDRSRIGTAAKPAFLQGDVLLRRTIPLIWSSRPAGALMAQGPSLQAAQAKREPLAPGRNGSRGFEGTAGPSPEVSAIAETEQRWSSLRPVHVRKRTSAAGNQAHIETQAHEGIKAQAAVPDRSATAALQAGLSESDPNMKSSEAMQPADRAVFRQEAMPAPDRQDEEAAEIVQAKLTRAGQPERTPTVHVRRVGRDDLGDVEQPAIGTIKRARQDTAVRDEPDSHGSSDRPVARFAKPGQARAAEGSSQRESDSPVRATMQERGRHDPSLQRNPLISLSQAERTQSDPSSPAADRSANVPYARLSYAGSRSMTPPTRTARGTIVRGAIEADPKPPATIVRGANGAGLKPMGMIVRGANGAGLKPVGMIVRGTNGAGLKPAATIVRGTKVADSTARGSFAHGKNAAGSKPPATSMRGANAPGLIVQRARSLHSNAGDSRTTGAAGSGQHSAGASTRGFNESGTIAPTQGPMSADRNTQPSAVPAAEAVQDDRNRQRDIPVRAAAVWRAGRANRQQIAGQPEQGAHPRTASVAAMVQRRQAWMPPSRGQSAAGGQSSLPDSNGTRQPAQRQTAAAIAMQPSAPLLAGESVAAAFRQATPISDRLTPATPRTARSNTMLGAHARSAIAHRAQPVLPRNQAATNGTQSNAAQERAKLPAAMQPNGSHAAEAAFTAIPLAYASAQAGSAAPSARQGASLAASPGSAAAPPMELRRQQAQPPAAPPPEASVSPSDVKAAIDPEQLQQAISKLPMLNPDQIADQVYKALAKRMKFEQRLQGY